MQKPPVNAKKAKCDGPTDQQTDRHSKMKWRDFEPKMTKIPKNVILSYPLIFEALPNLYASTY